MFFNYLHCNIICNNFCNKSRLLHFCNLFSSITGQRTGPVGDRTGRITPRCGETIIAHCQGRGGVEPAGLTPRRPGECDQWRPRHPGPRIGPSGQKSSPGLSICTGVDTAPVSTERQRREVMANPMRSLGEPGDCRIIVDMEPRERRCYGCRYGSARKID